MPLLRTLAIATCAAVAFNSATAQDSYPWATRAFTESAYLGMQLSVQQGKKAGSVTASRAQCVEHLPKSSFHPVVLQLLKQFLSQADLAATELFLATPVGQKYIKFGVLRIYPSVGAPLPEPLPEFSDAEYKELEAFAATGAGQLLIKNQVMQSAAARQAYGAHIRGLLASCAGS